MTRTKELPDLTLKPVFSREKFQELVQHQVIVEAWSKKNFGRGKRAWKTTFTEQERQVIAEWHGYFRRWHLNTGIPSQVQCPLKVIPLLQRACQFFAEV